MTPPALSVAPMMGHTDRHYRYLLRLISRRVALFSEMVTANAILRGPRDELLAFDPLERPVALQLGGDDPGALAECASIAEDTGYTEVNLNVGCPSDRVKSGRFGACLMRTPERVADAVAAMRARVRIPVTVKHRIGVDELDRFEDMLRFVDIVAAAGCRTFVVHARIAWLEGLSPRQNRTVPPLRHGDVHRLKRERPELGVVINGGIAGIDDALSHLRHVDGAMLGRAVLRDPFLLADADRRVFGDRTASPTRRGVVETYCAYVEQQMVAGVRFEHLARCLAELYHGQPGAAAWRRRMNDAIHAPGAGPTALRAGLQWVEDYRTAA